tara:strand:- start:569 stop:1942 length:1374 start_codon:yes stop_codon:yes gene_type:complete
VHTALSFKKVYRRQIPTSYDRPSLSYWQDAWARLKSNKRSFASLFIIIGLILFATVGPLLWRIDPSVQDLEQVSLPPSGPVTATIISPDSILKNVSNQSLIDSTAKTVVLSGQATTQAVSLFWTPIPYAHGYRIYRNILDPYPDNAFGLPLGDLLTNSSTYFLDQMDIQSRKYWYSVVPLTEQGGESNNVLTLVVEPKRVITTTQLIERGWVDDSVNLRIGSEIQLPWHPLGTDYLGRDMLARLMHGARVSLFIGIVAPIFYILWGILYGSIAGFLGGKVDHILMRFADFVVALPFLLFMILFKVAFGVEAGESGIMPMLVALILLSWPSTARLVRGQILQIREEAYVEASKLLGANTYYLILRHMLPNTMGVILVALTFAIPNAIFTEAFLSFIGMGVAPPTASWGSMSNEGIKTMQTAPHELIAPAVFISLTVLAFNLLGDGLRDALDTRMKLSE